MGIESVGLADLGQVPFAEEMFALSDRERDFFENKAGRCDQKYALITQDAIPERLQQHLTGLIERQLGKTGGCISIAGRMSLREECFPDAESDVPSAPLRQPNFPAVKMDRIETEKFSSVSDQEVLACFASPTFVNTKIDYLFDGYVFQIRIIHNPERDPLWAEGFPGPVHVPFIITAKEALSFELEHQLKKLALSRWEGATDYIMQVLRFRDYPYNNYADLRPIVVNKERALDADFDAKIIEAFASQSLANIVLHYQIEGESYQVRIIHNPERERLFATRYFDHPFLRKEISLPFPYKYGILVDKEAPQELIAHLSKLMGLSWWGLFTATSKICNGTGISFTEGDWEFTSKIPWSEFFSTLKSKEV